MHRSVQSYLWLDACVPIRCVPIKWGRRRGHARPSAQQINVAQTPSRANIASLDQPVGGAFGASFG